MCIYETGWITEDGGLVVDVARPYTKIQGRWLGRYRDLRFLEWSRASYKQGPFHFGFCA